MQDRCTSPKTEISFNMSKLKILTLLPLLFGLVANGQLKETMNLLPVPKNLERQSGFFSLKSDFTVSIQTKGHDTLLTKAVNRMHQTLSRRTGLYFAQQPKGFNDNSGVAALVIRTKKIVLPAIGTDESYTLKVTVSQIVIEAATTSGALHALQTLLQLCTKNGNQFLFPILTISDEPRFQWRGLMVDASRHFIPIDVLERNIDAMAAVKLNVLHLHLTDDQGFRIESKVYPLLHEKGSKGEYYTQNQIRDLISFAQERGIVIVPEFDLPGHCKSWLAGYPELASAPGPYEPGPPGNFKDLKGIDRNSVIDFMTTQPFPSLDPTKETTYTFLDRFFTEMAALFSSPYIHIGADESNGVLWMKNPDIVAFMQKNKIANVHDLQAYFISRVHQIISKKNKQMIGWDELFSEDISKNILVQVWRNVDNIKKAIDKGNQVLVSRGFYLDIFMPAYIHYTNPLLSADSSYSTSHLLKGGEAAQWTELADKRNIETRIWPRCAAIAERLWSPATTANVDDMYRRLYIINQQLDDLGVQHIANYHRALRLYASSENYFTLKTLTDVLTPVKGYKRLYTMVTMPSEVSHQNSPLNEVADFVFVDSEVKWKFREAVYSYLKNKDNVSEKIINNYLTLWQSNDSNFQNVAITSKQLERIKEHSKNLSIVASIGTAALSKIKAGDAPSDEWINKCMEQLLNINQAYGETELAIISEIEALIKQKIIPLPVK